MQTKQTIEQIVSNCSYKDWDILVRYDDERPYLQVHFKDADGQTGVVEDQWCGKWLL